jgi:uncharacterized membrane protein YphA (DoxX/SURF4 family)
MGGTRAVHVSDRPERPSSVHLHQLRPQTPDASLVSTAERWALSLESSETESKNRRMFFATLAARWLLAVILITAGMAKLGHIGTLTETVARYGVLPGSASRLTAQTLPSVELLLGIMLAGGVFVTPVATACAVLFGAFAAAVALNLMRGHSFDCGCGLGAKADISWAHVGRSIAFLVLGVFVASEPAALAVTVAHTQQVPPARELIAVPFGVVLLCVSWRLAGALRDTAPALRHWRRRRGAFDLSHPSMARNSNPET